MTALSIHLFPVDVGDYGVVHVRVVAPAADLDPDMTGFRPFAGPPRTIPVVVLLNGAGCPPERLHWLGVRLATAGFAAVSYGLLQRIGPTVTWSPGVDIAASAPTSDGTTPPCPVLVPLFAALAVDDRCTALDLTSPIAFGHSAGGSVALLSAGRVGLEHLRNVVAYGTHLVASTTSGRAAGSIMATKAVSTLIIGGGRDGVVQKAIDDGRYGENASKENLLTRSIAEGCVDADWAAAVQLPSAGHFACTEGYDGIGSSGHLEPAAADVDPADRAAIGDLVVSFCLAMRSEGFPAPDRLDAPRVNTLAQVLRPKD